MRPRPAPEIASIAEARAVLGLSGAVDADGLTRAFRAAVKTAGIGLLDADEADLRRLIAARDLLRLADRPLALPAPPPTRSQPPSPVTITATPEQALAGARVEVRIGGRRLAVRLPKGVRTGDRLRLRGAAPDGGELLAPVVLRGGERLSAVGDDLYMTWPVAPRVLRDGGRIEIETHAGPRAAWITPGHPTRRLRLKDLGLPARGRRPRGHLFVTLEPLEHAPSEAEDLMLRFTRVWTPERLAA